MKAKIDKVKEIIDFDVLIDVQSCYPDTWNQKDYDRFCQFIENNKVSKKSIKDNWITDEEMNVVFGEWCERNRACEIYDKIMWARIYKFNERAFLNPIYYPESASICAHI